MQCPECGKEVENPFNRKKKYCSRKHQHRVLEKRNTPKREKKDRREYNKQWRIRMDGENNSLVTSARETWLCTESFGCNPPETKPGVFGDGENSDLWRFPVPPFNFEGITMDLAEIKSLTKDQGQGLYFPPSGNEGYHAILKSNRTMDLYNVTAVDDVRAYDLEQGWYDEYSVVTGESFLGNYPIPGDCGLVFLEDDVWVSKIDQESSVKGKITLVSADLINPNAKSSVWLNGSVEYTTQDGSDGLVLVAQENNLIGLYVPDNMALEGVFIAQNGRFGRNYYPSTYSPYYMREKLEVYGSIVSNGREGTKWSCGGVYCSGFEKRENTYNPQLSFDPPPFLPATSEEYELKEWRETQ